MAEATREQLLAQLDAVRTVLTAMDNTTGARFWAQQLHTALRTRPGTVGPPLAWCGASAPGVGREPLGPCVLRAGHDGHVHQGTDGAKWWQAAPGKPGAAPAQCQAQYLMTGESAPWQCQRPAGHRGIHEQWQPGGVREWHEYHAVYPTTPGQQP
jgi:hypothetical protein